MLKGYATFYFLQICRRLVLCWLGMFMIVFSCFLNTFLILDIFKLFSLGTQMKMNIFLSSILSRVKGDIQLFFILFPLFSRFILLRFVLRIRLPLEILWSLGPSISSGVGIIFPLWISSVIFFYLYIDRLLSRLVSVIIC